MFLKNYLEKNKRECFNHITFDKMLINLIMNFFLFCNIPYFDVSKGEISHFYYNIDENCDKNLYYNRKLKMHDWIFCRKSYKIVNHFNSYLLGKHFRTALPGYDNYIYSHQPLSCWFILTYVFSFMIKIKSKMCMKTINFLSHE